MTRYRFYNESLIRSLIHHLKATMQPNPPTPPLQIFRVDTYVDNRGRTILAKTQQPDSGMLLFAGKSDFIGNSVAAVQVQDPRTRQVVVQQMQFQFPIPAESIHQAFAQFDTHQEPGFHKHMEAVKIASIKQGADLSQLPKPGRN